MPCVPSATYSTAHVYINCSDEFHTLWCRVVRRIYMIFCAHGWKKCAIRVPLLFSAISFICISCIHLLLSRLKVYSFVIIIVRWVKKNLKKLKKKKKEFFRRYFIHTSSTQYFPPFFFFNTSSASGSYPGAMIPSETYRKDHKSTYTHTNP